MHNCFMSHLLVLVLVLKELALVLVLLQPVLTTTLVSSSSFHFICPIIQQYAHLGLHEYNVEEQDSKVRQEH